jgi:hypothetical protein
VLFAFSDDAMSVVILRGYDFFGFFQKATLKTMNSATKKSPFGNLVTSSERSEGSLFDPQPWWH